MRKYAIVIGWSEGDRCFVSEVPQLPGCLAHGSTYVEALESVQEAMELWLDTAKEVGLPIPEPKSRRDEGR